MDLSRLMSQLGGGGAGMPVDKKLADTAETIHISSLALIKVCIMSISI